ncbi:hypothetical protein CU098_002027, partial [Rhizopus stolonifer]
MSGRNPKGAALSQSHYESPDVVACFEKIVSPLLAELQSLQGDVAFTARELSLLTGQLQQFQQDCLGAFNRPTNAPIRIPAKLLKVQNKQVITPDSAIYTVLLGAYSFRLRQGWKRWEFTNPSKKQKNADLIQSIRNLLIKRRFIHVPKIAMVESVDDNCKKAVLSMVKKIGATFVQDKNEATHILHGKLHEYNKDGIEEDWFRTLEKDGNMVLVHWWYYPDSFDSWLPQTQQFADPEEPPEHTGPWRINVRWLQDTVRFNEFMNEEDYEDLEEEEEEDEEEDDEEEEQEITHKRKRHQPVVRQRNIELERPQVGSRQRKNEFEPYLNGDMTNISQYTAEHVEYPKRRKIQKTEESGPINIMSLVTAMPYGDELSCPAWFSMDSIHAMEKLALPEYFTNQAGLTPEEYKECRDYMITIYRSNPDYYLTVSACKSKLDKDLVQLVRIHSFLELNQLINSQCDPRRRIFDPYIDSNPKAQVQPKSQRDFKDAGDANIEYLRDLIYNESSVSKQTSWDLDIQDPLNPDGRKTFHCSNCQVDCSEVRYQSLKTKNFQVCIDCFLEGRFPAAFSSSDFLRVEGLSDINMDEEWSDQETLRLLEGVDKFDDDWLMISEHVGSRSKEQCITQFLQLPINDAFLTAKLSQKEAQELPFSQQPNPVMTTVAFLSGHVNPGVGAAAAKTALKELIQSGQDQFSEQVMQKAQVSALKSAVENAHKLA